MEGKNCLITGATSGIGRSAALALSEIGANIYFIARDRNKAEILEKEIFDHSGKKPHGIIADLSSLKQIKQASEDFKSLDVPLLDGVCMSRAASSAGLVHQPLYDNTIHEHLL